MLIEGSDKEKNQVYYLVDLKGFLCDMIIVIFIGIWHILHTVFRKELIDK